MSGLLPDDEVIELFFFGDGPCLQDLDVGSLLRRDVEDFAEFIVDFEVGGRDDGEDGVAIVFEIELVAVCLVLGSGVGETFGSEVADIILGILKALNEDSLPVSQKRIGLTLGHLDMLRFNIIYYEAVYIKAMAATTIIFLIGSCSSEINIDEYEGNLLMTLGEVNIDQSKAHSLLCIP